MSRYTIIGSRGYIGSALVRYLKERGDEVATPERGTFPCGDLGRVIYAVGATRDYLENPMNTLDAHVATFAQLLRREFEHCWYLSSVRLYDFTGMEEVDETTPLSIRTDQTRSIYDATKACGETMALHGGKENVSVARLACVYGENVHSTAFLHELIAKARAGDRDSGSHEAVQRDYIHIDDVCRALCDTTAPSGLVNFSSGENISNAMLFRAIKETCGHDFQFRSGSLSVPPRVKNDKFVKAFAFQPRRVLEWLRQHLSE